MATKQWVYGFGGGESAGDASMKTLLGGKGANLAEMAKLDLPVPPGFTITTEVCTEFYENNRNYPADLSGQVDAALAALEKKAGKKFGDASNPLLVSVRSGSRASMPGMMDTVLNLGLNDDTVEGLAKLSGDARFAYDSYRRFIQMYSDVVLELEHGVFEEILGTHKDTNDYKSDVELTADDWKQVVSEYKRAVQRELGKPFPSDPKEQLWGAVGAVFASWMNDRAIFYRKHNNIPESWGTAVSVQAMVFGNMGDTSATGVAFTRDPSTGAKKFYGEFLINAQGEDVVAGIRTPKALTKASRLEMKEGGESLEEAMPHVFAELVAVYQKLESHYRDMQDLEFTVERGKLYMLQTRNGKRTAKAALKIAVDMAAEKLITQDEAVLRVDAAALDQLLHPTIGAGYKRDIICKGLPASPGAAVGIVVFDSDEAERLAADRQKVILVREETSPEDIHGMHASQAIVTARGGMTSHAAVVARGMGRPCVSGAGDIRIDMKLGEFRAAGRVIKKGETITVDGSSGEVLFGAADMVQPELTGDFGTLMEWADKARRMKVRANAETPADAATAVKFGAEGIGLCRTEHMFFDAERIAAVREMILAEKPAARVAALDKLFPHQRKDFLEIFQAMGARPVTIRFLDPPLHEFLPHTEEDCEDVAKATGLDAKALLARAKELAESNPMLGFRGCRLAIVYPEIYDMQARAVFEAACDVAETGDAPIPEIMIPFVITRKELETLRARVDAIAAEVFAKRGRRIEYLVGTMIELPRAALMAGDIAGSADFFSFGTNDLTQTTMGLSRDDAGKFLGAYVDKGMLERDPFVTIDVEGVGEMIKIASERGRKTRGDLKLGICGEHGGDPASVTFCESVGLDYVSCSPFRVPIARLAAAQAALAKRG
ncbi:pyruvate, phosphate dikinase [Terricaulis silvestris]|uniref:Pyruvate, phosphate dikinase n=1 Tax=Terricaulis silvestris TaxID=2686094 RepID=A0A6I6MVW9_9CAUL|nr:pyruvate, phosphate dikinase [Terricaulis silvestris]QGZ95762.1 Pyruvate, phosphate dikinase [Terricaulis silvestris]